MRPAGEAATGLAGALLTTEHLPLPARLDAAVRALAGYFPGAQVVREVAGEPAHLALSRGATVTDEQRRALWLHDDCTRLMSRSATARADHLLWRARREVGERDLGDGRAAIALARLHEHRRLAGAVLGLTHDGLNRLVTASADLTALVSARRRAPADPADLRHVEILDRLAAGIDDLVARLRRIAHGTYPMLLRTAGAGAALSEAAGELGVPVRVADDTLARAPWDVQSALFSMLLAVLQEVGRQPPSSSPAGPVGVTWFRRAGYVGAVVSPVDAAVFSGELGRGLAVEVGRLSALGGECSVAADDAGAGSVRVSMPDTLSPRPEPPPADMLRVELQQPDERPAIPLASTREPALVDADLAEVISAAARSTEGLLVPSLALLVTRAAQVLRCGVALEVTDVAAGSPALRWSAGPEIDPGRCTPVAIEVDGRTVGTWVWGAWLAPGSAVPGPFLALARSLVRTHADETAALRLRTDALRAEAELAEERRRASVDLDRERSAFEHDLHDGAQAELVAIKAQVSLARRAFSLGETAIAGLHAQLIADGARSVGDRISETAQGLISDELRVRGVAAALRSAVGAADDRPSAIAEQLDLVTVRDTTHGRRYPIGIETTAYFIVLEAVANARKHAPGSAVTVELDHRAGGLAVAVADSGPGMEAATLATAFTAIRRRVDSVAGRFTAESTPRGTRIESLLPF